MRFFPKGVVNIVLGRGQTVGAPLIAQPQVRMTSITGDVGTGSRVLENAANGIKRTHSGAWRQSACYYFQ